MTTNPYEMKNPAAEICSRVVNTFSAPMLTSRMMIEMAAVKLQRDPRELAVLAEDGGVPRARDHLVAGEGVERARAGRVQGDHAAHEPERDHDEQRLLEAAAEMVR